MARGENFSRNVERIAREKLSKMDAAELERRCRALYGLFRENGPAEPSPKMRVYVQRD